jgi:hypothetical protein
MLRHAPQTQGDGSASSPTNLQISKLREEQQEQPSQEPQMAFVRVITEFICPQGFTCPNSSVKFVDVSGGGAEPPGFSQSDVTITFFLSSF